MYHTKCNKICLCFQEQFLTFFMPILGKVRIFAPYTLKFLAACSAGLGIIRAGHELCHYKVPS